MGLVNEVSGRLREDTESSSMVQERASAVLSEKLGAGGDG